jgi:hypothetical protein
VMRLNAVENESSILNHIQCKSLCLPGCTHCKLELEEQWTSWHQGHFKATLFAWGTIMEVLLSECPVRACVYVCVCVCVCLSLSLSLSLLYYIYLPSHVNLYLILGIPSDHFFSIVGFWHLKTNLSF